MSDDKNPTPGSASPDDNGYVSDDRLAEALKRVRRGDLTPSASSTRREPATGLGQDSYEPVSATGAIGLPGGLGLSPTDPAATSAPAAGAGAGTTNDDVNLDNLLAPEETATTEYSPLTTPTAAPTAESADTHAANPVAPATPIAPAVTTVGSANISADPYVGLPSASTVMPDATPAVAPAAEPVVTEVPDDVLTIPADSPIAPLYVQAPTPPALRGNRGAGTWITILATLGFAVVYAGVIAAIYAPVTTADSFVTRLTDHLLTPAYFAPVAAFFVGLLLLVLIVNRAGWWAYVLGGFLVGILVYGAAVGGLIFTESLVNSGPRAAFDRVEILLLSPFTILAGVAAREVSVWFGAWIAARGRKAKRANAEELAEYEERLAASPLGQAVVVVD